MYKAIPGIHRSWKDYANGVNRITLERIGYVGVCCEMETSRGGEYFYVVALVLCLRVNGYLRRGGRSQSCHLLALLNVSVEGMMPEVNFTVLGGDAEMTENGC